MTTQTPADELATINGVPASKWGTWCPHGHRLIVPEPNRDLGDPFPAGVPADPWPCDAPQCSLEALEAAQEHAAGVIENERRREYFDTCSRGLA